jgi:hypothetical protein
MSIQVMRVLAMVQFGLAVWFMLRPLRQRADLVVMGLASAVLLIALLLGGCALRHVSPRAAPLVAPPHAGLASHAAFEAD